MLGLWNKLLFEDKNKESTQSLKYSARIFVE